MGRISGALPRKPTPNRRAPLSVESRSYGVAELQKMVPNPLKSLPAAHSERPIMRNPARAKIIGGDPGDAEAAAWRMAFLRKRFGTCPRSGQARRNRTFWRPRRRLSLRGRPFGVPSEPFAIVVAEDTGGGSCLGTPHSIGARFAHMPRPPHRAPACASVDRGEPPAYLRNDS